MTEQSHDLLLNLQLTVKCTGENEPCNGGREYMQTSC